VLPNGVVKLMDFGIARVAEGADPTMAPGQTVGTPYYMSPEQASGDPVDERADIYALGIVMYEMFTGRVPFEADTFMGVLTKHIYVEPTPPSVLLGGVASLGALEQITLRCLEKKPEHRFPSMQALGAELARVASFDEDGAFHVEPLELREPRGPHRLADELELPTAGEVRVAERRLAPRLRPFEWAILLGVVTLVAALVSTLILRARQNDDAESTPAGSSSVAGIAVPSAPTAATAPQPERRADAAPAPSTSPQPILRARPRTDSPRPGSPPGSAPSPSPKPSIGKGKSLGGEIVDPWSH